MIRHATHDELLQMTSDEASIVAYSQDQMGIGQTCGGLIGHDDSCGQNPSI